MILFGDECAVEPSRLARRWTTPSSQRCFCGIVACVCSAW